MDVSVTISIMILISSCNGIFEDKLNLCEFNFLLLDLYLIINYK